MRLIVKLLRTPELVSCLLPLFTAFSFGVTFVLQICCDVTLSRDHASLWSPLTDVLSSLLRIKKHFALSASSYHHYWCFSFIHLIFSDWNWMFPGFRVQRVHHTRVWWLREEWCYWIFTERVSDLQHCVERHLYLCRFVWLNWRKKCNVFSSIFSYQQTEIYNKYFEVSVQDTYFFLCYCVDFWGLSTSLWI